MTDATLSNFAQLIFRRSEISVAKVFVVSEFVAGRGTLLTAVFLPVVCFGVADVLGTTGLTGAGLRSATWGLFFLGAAFLTVLVVLGDFSTVLFA
ncbi:hypothetical protein Trydic_g7591 [Trypoxylus dichotomus]